MIIFKCDCYEVFEFEEINRYLIERMCIDEIE